MERGLLQQKLNKFKIIPEQLEKLFSSKNKPPTVDDTQAMKRKKKQKAKKPTAKILQSKTDWYNKKWKIKTNIALRPFQKPQ